MHFNIENIPGRTVTTQKGQFLWFGGTSYLGVGHHPEFKKLINIGFEKVGTNWGSSRSNPLQHVVYEHVEQFMANFTGAPATLTCSSGMLAGQIVIKYLNQQYKKALQIHAPRVHPALWMNDYTPNTSTYENFINNLNESILSSENEAVIILADAVPSPHFETYNFKWAENLPTNKQIILVIDDSHSIGIMGRNGSGIYSQLNLPENITLLVIASLNKAMGVPAGVILGKKTVLDAIRKTAFFMGCSPMSPGFAYASAHAGDIYKNTLEILKNNIEYFNKKWQGILPLENILGHPAYCLTNESAQPFLQKNGILVPSFSYPSPTDKPITRLVISALHTTSDLDKLFETLLKLEKK